VGRGSTVKPTFTNPTNGINPIPYPLRPVSNPRRYPHSLPVLQMTEAQMVAGSYHALSAKR
jgi:hypothetical protein